MHRTAHIKLQIAEQRQPMLKVGRCVPVLHTQCVQQLQQSLLGDSGFVVRLQGVGKHVMFEHSLT